MSIDPGALMAAWRRASAECDESEMRLVAARASHACEVQRAQAAESEIREALRAGREAQLELAAMDGEDCSRAYARMRISLATLVHARDGDAYANDLQAVLDGTEEDHPHDETGEEK